MSVVQMSFRDAPIGARFIYPGTDSVWIKINAFPESMYNSGDGLIVRWEGNVEGHQNHCSFVDKDNGINFDTIIELI